MNSDILKRANEQIIESRTVEQVFRAMRGTTEALGFKHVVYYLPKRPRAPAEGPVQYVSYPAEWVHRYYDKSYIDIDPVVRASVRSIVPIDWDTLDRRHKRVQSMFGEAEDAGVGKRGLTITLRSQDMAVALFSVTSDANPHEWADLKSKQVSTLQSLGSLVHERILQIVAAKSTKMPKLSAREIECVTWCARGLHDQEIADRLGISLSVTRAYLESAKFKLGAITRPNLVGLAIKFCILAEDFI